MVSESLYTESADDRKPLLVNQFYVKTGILMSRIMFLVKVDWKQTLFTSSLLVVLGLSGAFWLFLSLYLAWISCWAVNKLFPSKLFELRLLDYYGSLIGLYCWIAFLAFNGKLFSLNAKCLVIDTCRSATLLSFWSKIGWIQKVPMIVSLI